MYKVKVTKQMPVKYLRVYAEVRYWEDSRINGVEDSEKGENIPLKEDDDWAPTIDLDKGVVLDWPEDKEADIHYKVCDQGQYLLLDDCFEVVTEIDGYVPSILDCSEEQDAFGDYIIMHIDKTGKIKNWEVKLSEFES